jgi:hypothetical protein
MSQPVIVPGALVGRDRDLDLLREFFRQSAVSGGALVLTGEPGVGKTALINALADAQFASGTMVLRAAGSQFEEQISFAGLNQALLPLLDSLDELSDVHRDALRVAFGLVQGHRAFASFRENHWRGLADHHTGGPSQHAQARRKR